jgi:HSP20 family molecular chaperone IbpA
VSIIVKYCETRKSKKMQALPIFMDFVDEMKNSLDYQDGKSFIDQFAPFFIIPQHQQNQQRCPGQQQQQQPRRCKRGNQFQCTRRNNNATQETCCQKVDSQTDIFQVAFDVQSFKPEEINVKVKGREIMVEGKHEDRVEGDMGFVSRQFTRRFTLPDDFDIETVSTLLSIDGKMTIKALKPQPPAVETKERVIPIQRIPADVEDKEKGSEKVTEVEKSADVSESNSMEI